MSKVLAACRNRQWVFGVVVLGSLLLVGCKDTPPVANTMKAVDVTTASAKLQGEVLPNVVTDVRFQYGTAPDLSGDAKDIQLPDTLSPSTSYLPVEYQLNGLSGGMTYYYRVIAKNRAGESKGSIMSFKTLGTAVAAPTAVGQVSNAAAPGTSTPAGPVAVAGTASTPIAGASGSPTSTGTSSTAPTAAPPAGVATSSSAPTVTPAAPVPAPTLAPKAPPTVGLLAPTFIHTNDMTLRGTIKPNQLPATARFEYSTSASLSSNVGIVDVENVFDDVTTVVTVSCFISDLREGTTYYFRLVGANGSGTSKTDIISMTTLASGGAYRP